MRNNRRRGELINLGQLRVDSGRNRVTIGSETQVVRPQVMDLLVYLAKQRNQVVSTEQILEDIWVDKVVTKASIYQTMAELRRVIAAADDVRVETIKRRGYRLSAPSPDDSSSALQAHSAAPDDTVKRSSNRSRMALWAVFFALLGLLVFEIYRQQTATPESFDRLRSEVLEAVRRDAESSGNIDPDKAEQIVDDMLSELMLESGPAQRRAVELLAAGDPDEAAKELAELGEQLADGAEVDDKVAQAFRNADEAAKELAELGDHGRAWCR
jgi:DNA-binding winged helix-turn-helix (wHTH) protein